MYQVRKLRESLKLEDNNNNKTNPLKLIVCIAIFIGIVLVFSNRKESTQDDPLFQAL